MALEGPGPGATATGRCGAAPHVSQPPPAADKDSDPGDVARPGRAGRQASVLLLSKRAVTCHSPVSW